MPELFHIDGVAYPCEGSLMSVRDILTAAGHDWRYTQLVGEDGRPYANRGELVRVDGKRFETRGEK